MSDLNSSSQVLTLFFMNRYKHIFVRLYLSFCVWLLLVITQYKFLIHLTFRLQTVSPGHTGSLPRLPSDHCTI